MAMAIWTSLVSPKLLPLPRTPEVDRCSLRKHRIVTRCESSQQPQPESSGGSDGDRLQIGSPIIMVEAPPTLKTAASMPTLKVNAGLVKPGDVGRIVARKPKDVWAVRLAIGTYLIDGKHFKPLDLDESS